MSLNDSAIGSRGGRAENGKTLRCVGAEYVFIFRDAKDVLVALIVISGNKLMPRTGAIQAVWKSSLLTSASSGCEQHDYRE